MSYTYTDMSGSHTSTGYPFVTRYFMSALDYAIEEAIPAFVSTNLYTNGNYNGYYLDYAYSPGGTYRSPPYLPTESVAGMFLRYGVGYVTNLTSNAWRWVDGGDYEWTKQSATTSGWLLAETHYSTNDSAWHFVNQQTFDTNYYLPPNMYPAVVYTSSGTNYSNLPISLTVSGEVLNITNQTLSTTSEVINVTSSNTPMTKYWYSISSLASATSVSNADVLAIVWTNELVHYGAWAFQLDAHTLDERWTIINGLRWTQHDQAYQLSSNLQYYSGQITFTNSSYALARADAEAAFDNLANWSAGSGGLANESLYYRQYNIGTQKVASVADSKKWVYRAYNIPTNIQHSAELYTAFSEPSLFDYYDFTGRHPDERIDSFEASFPESLTTNRAYSNAWVNPASAVSTNADFQRNQTTYNITHWLLKWDGANGLKWK